MGDYLEKYKEYELKIWAEDGGLFGAEYKVGQINRIWQECSLGNILALFYEKEIYTNPKNHE